MKTNFSEYFLGIETFQKNTSTLDKFIDGFVAKIVPTMVTCSGIAYGFYSKEPHTPGNIVLVSELFRLMYYRIGLQ
ncbi:hypothetical protein HY837_04540 [archaeon]|nr:hypothetical protein [archaeon]